MTKTVSVLAAVTIAVSAGVVLAASVARADPEPANKVAAQALEQAERAKDAAVPHGPKIPLLHPGLPPVRADFNPGIAAFTAPGPMKAKHLTSVGRSIGSDGRPYTAYAGAADDDELQGILFLYPDTEAPVLLKVPGRDGAVTFTSASGDLLMFRTGGGRSGSFDVVTRAILVP